MRGSTSEVKALEPTLRDFYSTLLKDTSLLAPDGHVVVVGYPLIFADPTSWDGPPKWFSYCYGFYKDDAAVLRGGIANLNFKIKSLIAEIGKTDPRIHYVDVNGAPSNDPFRDHLLCSKEQWLNGLVGGSSKQLRPEKSFHPNQKGHDAYAAAVVQELRRLRFKGKTVDGQEPVTATTVTTIDKLTGGQGSCELTQTGQGCTNDGRESGLAIVGGGTTIPSPAMALGVDGIGSVAFGTPMDTAISAISRSLGPPDYLGPWADPYCESGGPGSGGGQLVVWGDLAVTFTDGGVRVRGEYQRGARVLGGYQYGGFINDYGGHGEVPITRRLGLRTVTGIGLGSTGREIQDAYGLSAEARPGDPSEFPGPGYVIASAVDSGEGFFEGFFVKMDANGPDGRVIVIEVAAGGGCGE